MVVKLFQTTALATMLLAAGAAFGGGVQGKIAAPSETDDENSRVVVWIEGDLSPTGKTEETIVNQSGIQFVPQLLVVTAGQTVEMPNNDNVAHNVFSMSPAKQFKLGIYPKGESRSVTFEEPGVIDLFCSIHRHMHAVIVVTPSGHYAEAKVGEEYKIEDVPDGEYTIKAWNPAFGVTEIEKVTVSGDTTLDIELSDNG